MPFLSCGRIRLIRYVTNKFRNKRKANDFRTQKLHIPFIKNQIMLYPRFCVVKRVSRSASFSEERGLMSISGIRPGFPSVWGIKLGLPSILAGRSAGSMTAEACIALPLFLFFTVNVLSMILFFHTYISDLEQLHQQGRQLSMLAYATGEGEFLENNLIQLVRPARVQPVIPILGYPGTTLISCCYMRAWTGYDVEHRAPGDSGEVYVYITEGGSVYHVARNCTYLTLSIQVAGETEVEGLRNASGGKYGPCEKCARTGGTGIVYITKEGSSYHNTITCSGLKRTVRCVPLSEAGGRTPCSRCG